MPPRSLDSPAKKQSKWSPSEDALIIELRGRGMKWDDISKRLPGRSPISCRLHYQNYLERRSEWDEEKKNKLARLYERFKPEMWARVAEEMQVPWRAAEAMHWHMGEADIARRAGVAPFYLASTGGDTSNKQHQLSPSRGHSHSQSLGSVPHDYSGTPAPTYGMASGTSAAPPPGPPFGPSSIPPHSMAGRGVAVRQESMVPRHLEAYETSGSSGYAPQGPGLAPLQTNFGSQGRAGTLPSVAELTTGISPYNTTAYSAGIPVTSPPPGATLSPGPFPESGTSYPRFEPAVTNGGTPPSTRYYEIQRPHLDPGPEEKGQPRQR
ncbi:hypothetical protein VTK73DRAFT_8992 [Phialemonium thermophilum]|uniref:Uncharacterized protein n=1 Tax=Phialemonium thermophilum TaxID=223376 RepID=A0ABR3XMF4_9PEZI